MGSRSARDLAAEVRTNPGDNDMSCDEKELSVITPDRADYDSPWKKALEVYFKEGIQFFFPEMASDVDWSRGYMFLEKELHQVTKDAALGRRYGDKLVQVYRKNGQDEWVLVHIEVQGQKKANFTKRMYTYNYRIFDLFDRKVASVAILADDNSRWRPDHFSYELWGSKAGLWFPTVKLLDYKEKWEKLDASKNPFASVVMAHLKALETEGDNERRYRWKLLLIKRLYRLGYDKQDVIRLFQFIDWTMSLPDELEEGLWMEIQKLEEEAKMEYVTSVERIGIKKGMQQGIQQGMQQGIQQGTMKLLSRQIARRFQVSPDSVHPIFARLTTEQLEELGEMFVDAESLDEIRVWADEQRLAKAQ